MPEKHSKNTCITILLLVILVGIIIETGYILTKYYTSSEHIVDMYVRSLENRDYKSIYRILEKASVSEVGGEQEVINYYKRIYDVQHKLMDVKVMEVKENQYKMQYIYKDKEEKGEVHVVKKGNRWRILFPFEFNSVEVFGPNGCTVYLDDYKLKDSQNGRYIGSYILPGQYLLQVQFPMSTYNNYYRMISIPEDNMLVLPYETGNVKIHTAPGLKIKVGQFEKISCQGRTLFSELLPGDYLISVEDPNGYMKTQTFNAHLEKNTENYYLQDYELTEAGEQKYEAFLKDFYEIYKNAIKEKEASMIKAYICKENEKDIIDVFSSWYIDKKDISDFSFSYDCGEKYFDTRGKLHQSVSEMAILYNNEKDDNGSDIVRAYKIGLTWHITSEIVGSEWKIKDREMEESVVAVKDDQDRWIQY